ncbi:cytochrome P450 [Syncephalis fuscata]|nr:cytochrome P450 [Syncephalis fuscata]
MPFAVLALFSSALWWEIPLVIGAAYIVQKIIECEFVSPLAKIPGPRPTLWTVVALNIKQLYTEDPNIIINMHKKYGPIVRTGPKTVWVSESEMIRKMLSSHKYKKGAIFDAFKIGGDNLFATRDIEFHRVQKRLMGQAYTPTALKELEPMIYKVGVARLVARLRRHANAGETIDLMNLLKYMAFDVIGKIGFGKSFNLLDETEKIHPIMDWIDSATTLGVKKLFLGSLFHPSMARQNIKDTDSLLDFAKQTVEKRRNSDYNGGKDTLQQLFDAIDEETGATMSNETIVAQSILLMVAGTDTTSVTLTWIMYFMTEYPECAQKLREEIMAVYPYSSTEIAYDAIKSLPYLEAVLQESMRMRSIVSHGLYREIPEEGLTLGGYFLPPGTVVTSCIILINFDENVFPDPHVFRPERWLTTPEHLATMKKYSIPFSIGPRACIARNLAWMELRLTIVELMRHFTFTPSSKNDMTPIESFTLRPKGNMFLVQPHNV